MKVKLSADKKTITITMPVDGPTPSASGKSLVLASTRGNKVSDAEFDGRRITIGLNAYVKNAA